MSRPTVDLRLKVLKESDSGKALLVTDGTLGKGDRQLEVWLPKSQIEDHDWEGRLGEFANFTIPEWLAVEKDLAEAT
jgi:hypothetical protein